jgi:hypothetical protein
VTSFIVINYHSLLLLDIASTSKKETAGILLRQSRQEKLESCSGPGCGKVPDNPGCCAAICSQMKQLVSTPASPLCFHTWIALPR